MSAKTIWALVGALLVAGAGVAATGCSSDDSSNANPTPTAHDSGTGTGSDSSAGNPDSGTPQTGDSGPQGDSGNPNPNCQSDAATCNSCVTPDQDPLNACSQYTGNCKPFDNKARGVPNPLPPVP